jgi:hypothetical protein
MGFKLHLPKKDSWGEPRVQGNVNRDRLKLFVCIACGEETEAHIKPFRCSCGGKLKEVK